MCDQIRLSVPCNLHYRDAIGALIMQLCKNLRGKEQNKEMAFQVISAFNEAFNNTVAHSTDIQKHIEIIIETSENEIVIELKDEGEPYNFDDVAPPDLETMPESGLGIYIIRSFMDQVEYFPGEKGQKNRLRMVRKFS